MFICDGTSRRHAAQSSRSQSDENDLRRAIAQRDTTTVRAIARRYRSTDDMRELLWRVAHDDRAIAYVGTAWEGINGWYR